MTGTELKQRRKGLGYSQEKLARVFDVSNSTIARWEQMLESEIKTSNMLHLSLRALECGKDKEPEKRK